MRKIIIPIVIILIGILFSSVYVVEEGTRGIVLRFNKIIALSEPGLHFKLPGVDNVRIVDAKIQTTGSSNNGVEQKFINREKNYLIVDYFVQWKITNFNRYYETIAGGNSIEDLLMARLNGRLRAEIGKLDINDIINDSNAETKSRNSLMLRVKDALNGKQQKNMDIESVSSDYQVNQSQIDAENITSMRAFGIEVIDVRIKQIDFPAAVSKSIYDRMSEERKVFARDKRFQGYKKAEEIRAQSKLTATKILSEAEKQARTIRGEGDANAARIYAEAFSKDLEFYNFIRSLKAYEESFKGNDIMVISPDSEFFNYMKLDTNIKSDRK